METKYSLVLTGSVLPGFAPESVWPALAAYFRMEPHKLSEQVLVRAPLTIKESEDLGKLQTLQAGAAAVGAESDICAPDGRPSLFVLLDGKPRGPVPRVFVEERIEHGLWPTGVMVAEVGSSNWLAYASLSPPPEAPAETAEAVAEEPNLTVAAERRQGYAPSSAADHGHALAATMSVGEEPQAEPMLPPGGAIHAGFWRRCSAYLMDGFIVAIGCWIISMILILALAATGSIGAVIAGVVLNYVVLIVLGWLYYALQESSAAQATLGKRAMGIKVTDDRGHRISFGRATGRFFGKIISGLVLNIGFMLAGWTERKQALHDLMASTLVVFRGVEPGEPMPTVRPPMPCYGWAINIVCLTIFPIAILAAIALPAYQDYATRAQAAAAYAAGAAAKTAVAEFHARENRCPDSNQEAGLGEPRTLAGGVVSSIAIEPDCRIVVTFAGSAAVNSNLRGQRIEMTAQPDASGALEWNCSGTLGARYMPLQCNY